MRTAAGLLLTVSLCLPPAVQEDAAAVAQKVADVERQLPWFWTPTMEGLSDVPYTFETKDVRRTGAKSWSLQLERIPLATGAYYHCLMQNGTSPCSAQMVSALEADSQKAANFTPEEKAKAASAKEGRRLLRRAFWTDFPKALHFQSVGQNEIAFAPNGKYKAQHDPDTSRLMLKGQFRYDPQTFEIVEMSYAALGDIDVPTRFYKGSDLLITLSKKVDDHYLPVHQVVHRVLPKGGLETSEVDFGNYRRFATDSSVEFVDKDKER